MSRRRRPKTDARAPGGPIAAGAGGWKSQWPKTVRAAYNNLETGRNDLAIPFKTRSLAAFVMAAGVLASCGSGGEESSANKANSNNDGAGWREILTGVGGQMVGAEHDVLFYAFDTLAYPNEPVDLTARLQSAKNFKSLKGATIGFYQGEEETGAAETGDDGYARISWTPPKAGDYEFTVRITKPPEDDDYSDAVKVTPAQLLVAARAKKAELAIVDLDHTVVDSSFWRVLMGGAKPMAGSADVMHKLAKRYTIVYLTHRPDILTRKSKSWLIDNGYPRAPLMVSELKDAIGDSGKFKTARLKAIRESYPNVRIGIGDKLSDAQAYVDNGIKAYLIPYYKNKPKDMQKTADAIRQLKGRGNLQVVSGWTEVEAGIFRRKTFAPNTFASRLDAEARRMLAEERREKDRKDKEEEEDD